MNPWGFWQNLRLRIRREPDGAGAVEPGAWSFTNPRLLMLLLALACAGTAWNLAQQWLDRPRFWQALRIEHLGEPEVDEALRRCVRSCDREERELALKMLPLQDYFASEGSEVSVRGDEMMDLLAQALSVYEGREDFSGQRAILRAGSKLLPLLGGELPAQDLFHRRLYRLQLKLQKAGQL